MVSIKYGFVSNCERKEGRMARTIASAFQATPLQVLNCTEAVSYAVCHVGRQL